MKRNVKPRRCERNKIRQKINIEYMLILRDKIEYDWQGKRENQNQIKLYSFQTLERLN